MRYFIIAGETSGDLHGSNLIRSLKQEDKDATFTFVGGDMMTEAVGTAPILHTSELAFMGFVEVLANLRTINKNLKHVQEALKNDNPDTLILIDYPGFNMRIAAFAKKNGWRVCYYISPKIWAWNQKRVHKIKKLVDRMYCILPFEKAFYKKWNMEVEYVGNPLLDVVLDHPFDPHFRQTHQLDEKPIIALLPGSRKMEIKNLLPRMSQLQLLFPAHQFVIAGAPNLEEDFYRQYNGGQSFRIIYDAAYDLLRNAEAAVITSGTATLEAALLRVPQVVVYRANPITVAIARSLIQVRFIALPNLINNMLSVRELIQQDCTPHQIADELDLLINDQEYRDNIQENYDLLRQRIGDRGASNRTAKSMVEFLKNTTLH